MAEIRDSKGNVVMWEGKPWDGKDPEYIRLPDGEEFYGEGLLEFKGAPKVTKKQLKEINSPDKARRERIARQARAMDDEQEGKRTALRRAGIMPFD